MFNNLKELIATMQDEQTCRDYLAKQRWEGGKAICPYCGHTKCYNVRKGTYYKCASPKCYKIFSVTAKTIFHASNIPLSKWFMAIYLCSAHKKGISSYQLAKDIGIAQNSAWFMLHRIRKMMQVNNIIPLEEFVETDVTFIGGKIGNKPYKIRRKYNEDKNYFDNKTSVLGITQRGGNTIMKIIPKNATGMIDKTLRDNIKADSIVVTDEAATFDKLHKSFKHESVNHSKNEFVRDVYTTNTIEGIFSHLKRGIYGIYHQISPKHTERYLDEFTYRYNSRKIKDNERFVATFQNISARLPYKELISTFPVLEFVKKVKPVRTYSITKKAVMQVKDDEVIATYESVWQAAKATGLDSGNINKVANGKRKSIGGYKWIFV